MENKEFSRYLTYGNEDERWQLVCVDAGYAKVLPNTEYPPKAGIHPAEHRTVATGRTVAEYQLVYITQGRGEFRPGIDKEYLQVQEGNVILVLPGLYHAYKPSKETGWTERWVGFKGPWADALRKEGVLSTSHLLFYPGLDGVVLELFTELFAIVEEQKPFYQARAASMVMRLLAEILARSRYSQQGDDSSELVSRAKFIMAEQIYGNISIEEIGEQLGVGHVRFYEVFRTYTGLTPYQYFIQLKINKAKELLAFESCTVKEAAFRLGFEDQYYFSRLFKKKTGVSPSEWK